VQTREEELSTAWRSFLLFHNSPRSFIMAEVCLKLDAFARVFMDSADYAFFDSSAVKSNANMVTHLVWALGVGHGGQL